MQLCGYENVIFLFLLVLYVEGTRQRWRVTCPTLTRMLGGCNSGTRVVALARHATTVTSGMVLAEGVVNGMAANDRD
ncbi:hypothetical protein SESBI_38436 [Sesbania bispinosa]|nr:hypothetical protein SESBI_38436 [Sesbania bispinosa]